MTPEETFHHHERRLIRMIEHCVSVIALCRVSHSHKAELAYELQFARHSDELRTLRATKQDMRSNLDELRRGRIFK
jgi:hypothetical protein